MLWGLRATREQTITAPSHFSAPPSIHPFFPRSHGTGNQTAAQRLSGLQSRLPLTRARLEATLTTVISNMKNETGIRTSHVTVAIKGEVPGQLCWRISLLKV